MPVTHSDPSRRWHLAAASLLALSGCDIRDEMPRQMRSDPLLGRGIVAAGRGGERSVEYVGGLEAGRKRAAGDGRPLLLVCTAGWCRFSADMAQRTLRDPRLVALSRRAVCVLLDADRDAETCADLGVRAFPTLLVLDADGTERLRSTGRSAPEVLATVLEQAFAARRLATAADGDSAIPR